MKSRDFCFWLQGYLEISATDGQPNLTQAKVECIQRHLALVFKHEIDPSMAEPEPAPKTEHEKKLDAAHKPPGWPGKDLVMRC